MNAPFRYEPGDGLLHRLNPLAKLACLVLLSSALMGAPWPLAALLAAFCLACVLRMGTRPQELIREGRFIVGMAIFIFALKCFDPAAPYFLRKDQVLHSLAYSGNLCTLFLLAEIFFRSTRVGEIGSTASVAARRILGRDDVDPGIYLALAVDFMPRVIAAYRECADAAGARGYGKKRSPLSSSRKTLIAFLILSIKKALRTAEALEARCYRPDRTLEAAKTGYLDLAAVAVCVAYLVLCIVL